MTSTISSTVRNALPAEAFSRFPDQVTAVEAALTERDHQLTDVITATVVQRFAVEASDVQSALEGIGMAVRPAPEPEPVVEDEPVAEEAPAKKGKKGKKAKKDKGLEAKVNALIELAERHLGVSVR